MKEFQIRLVSTHEVGEFVKLASEQPYPIRVSDGERLANAKSFIGMFSLDCRKPLTVSAQAEDAAAFAEDCKKFPV